MAGGEHSPLVQLDLDTVAQSANQRRVRLPCHIGRVSFVITSTK